MSIAYWLICSKNHCNEGIRKIQIFFDNINIKQNLKKLSATPNSLNFFERFLF